MEEIAPVTFAQILNVTSLISYAQNFEDVMLWRALKHVEGGHYIDVGAQGPVIDSVSKFFHEQGWRGIHVEPTPHYAEQLRKERESDIVLQAAVGTKTGALKFFEFPDTGLSTFDGAIAKKHVKAGFECREIVVPCISLDDVFAQSPSKEIHWLKIDVEGGEQQVLKSWQSSNARPWIVLVESTLPLTQTESHGKWEPLLDKKGYRFAYFDGLNRFYVSTDHLDLLNAFKAGPNLFDGFLLSRNSWPWCTALNAQIGEAEGALEASKNEAREMLFRRDEEIGVLLAIEQEKARKAEADGLAALSESRSRLIESQQAAFDAARALAEAESCHAKNLLESEERSRSYANALVESEREMAAKLEATRATLEAKHSKAIAETATLRDELVAKEKEVSNLVQVNENERLRQAQILEAANRDNSYKLAILENENSAATSLLRFELASISEQLKSRIAEVDKLQIAVAEAVNSKKAELDALRESLVQNAQRFESAMTAAEHKWSEKWTAHLLIVEVEKAGLIRAHEQKAQELLAHALRSASREQEIGEQILFLTKKSDDDRVALGQRHKDQVRQLMQESLDREGAANRTLHLVQQELLATRQATRELERAREIRFERAFEEWSAERQQIATQCRGLSAVLLSTQMQLRDEIAARKSAREELEVATGEYEERLKEANLSLTANLAEVRDLATRNRETEEMADQAEKSLRNEISVLKNQISIQQSQMDSAIRVGGERFARFEHDVRSMGAKMRAIRDRIYWEYSSEEESEATGHLETMKPPSSASHGQLTSQPAQAPFAKHESATVALGELVRLDGIDFVNMVFKKVLGRLPDPSAAEFYLDRLTNGAGKKQIIAEIRSSDEGRRNGVTIEGFSDLPALMVTAARTWEELSSHNGRAFINCAYQTILGRMPDKVGYDSYLRRLVSGVSKMEMVAEIRSSKEGSARHIECENLDAKIRQQKLASLPLIGRILNVLFRIEGNGDRAIRARHLEQCIFEQQERHVDSYCEHQLVLHELTQELANLVSAHLLLERLFSERNNEMAFANSAATVNSSVLSNQFILTEESELEMLGALAAYLNRSKEAHMLRPRHA